MRGTCALFERGLIAESDFDTHTHTHTQFRTLPRSHSFTVRFQSLFLPSMQGSPAKKKIKKSAKTSEICNSTPLNPEPRRLLLFRMVLCCYYIQAHAVVWRRASSLVHTLTYATYRPLHTSLPIRSIRRCLATWVVSSTYTNTGRL